MNKFEYKNLTPFKWFVLENFPFIEADFDALTEWQLFCKLGKEMNIIINKINNVGTQTENLTNNFINLTEYVNNYFDNLDIQTEINNKLNEMAQSGELAEIITSYLEVNGILAFNTVNDLKNATNIINGSFTRTFGKISYNDGEGAFYKISNIKTDDVIDDINIIKINNSDTLVAELIKDKTLEEIKEEVQKIIENINVLRYQNHKRIYIDGINGNDENIGSQSAPIKTIDKFFSMCNNGKTDIRGNIVTSGTYTIHKSNISHIAVHLTGLTNNIIITSDNENNGSGELVFYHCHINFENLIFDLPERFNKDFYFEGCSVGLKQVTFKTPVQMLVGTTLNSVDCKYNVLGFFQSNGYLSNTTFDGKAKIHSPIYSNRGCNIDIEGTLTVEELEEDTSVAFATFYRSTIYMAITLQNQLTTNKYSNGILSNYIVLVSTNGYISSLANLSDNANNMSHTANVSSLYK